jgi:hypothetical protein
VAHVNLVDVQQDLVYLAYSRVATLPLDFLMDTLPFIPEQVILKIVKIDTNA